uniref:Exostosin GT47 domain-containing protein n=1 Tax=viral metagenome TaxID=1070528 RepID=A0A6C0JK66_9ZZZZ
MVKAFYLKNAFWEIDFLVRDVFVGLDVSFFNETEPMLLEPSDIGNCLLVVNDSYSLERVLKIVKKIKPVCIFHLSDETGSKSDWFVLASHCTYLFKQHNHRHCRIDTHPNIIQLCLGYVPTMFVGLSTPYPTMFVGSSTSYPTMFVGLSTPYPTMFVGSSTPYPTTSNSLSSFDFINELMPICERSLDWAFIGSLKSDRQEMCTCFAEAFTKRYISVGNNSWDSKNQIVRPSDMADIYRKTVFVPIGRGWVTLDCFRFYEALLCGAIPIVVGPSDEIDVAYCYGGNMPSCIRASSWQEAVIICKRMRDSAEGLVELQKIQNQNVAWWKGLVLGYRVKIKEAFTKKKLAIGE